MKCDALVRRVEQGKKRKRLVITHIFSRIHQDVEKFPLNSDGGAAYNTYKEDEFERCDGNVKASINVHIDGGCSCCGYANLEVEYKCDKCGNTHFEELPRDEESLSELLTEHVAKLSKASRKAKLDEMVEAKAKRDAEMEKYLKKTRRK